MSGDYYFKLGASAEEFGEEVEAEKWYVLATDAYKETAEKGDINAQLKLARCFEYGRGVARDIDEAKLWYKQAADQGNAEAQFKLGCFYHDVDRNKARKWYQKAAKQGHEEAKYNVPFLDDD